jgi:hypothetical protein
LATTPINDLLKDVALYYGFSDSAEIVWGRTNINTSQQNRQLLEELNSDALPLREYLKRRYPELSEVEVEKWAKEIEKQKSEKAKREQASYGNALFDDRDMYGTDYVPTKEGGDLIDDAEK